MLREFEHVLRQLLFYTDQVKYESILRTTDTDTLRIIRVVRKVIYLILFLFRVDSLGGTGRVGDGEIASVTVILFFFFFVIITLF